MRRRSADDVKIVDDPGSDLLSKERSSDTFKKESYGYSNPGRGKFLISAFFMLKMPYLNLILPNKWKAQ